MDSTREHCWFLAPTNYPSLYCPACRADRGNWDRAGGDVICGGCTRPYYDHRSARGAEPMRILCDGRLVKL